MLALVGKYLLSGLGSVGNTVKRRFLFTIVVIKVILLTWLESVPGFLTVLEDFRGFLVPSKQVAGQ